jgi:predicted metalloprotease
VYGQGAYPAAPPSASPWQAAPPQSWAPPQSFAPGYQGPVGSYGQYGFQPGTYPYPPVAPPKESHVGRALLFLLVMAILVGVAVPVISALTSAGYANSSYVPPVPNVNPPSLPKVSNAATAHDTVTASSLYGQSVPNPTKCTVTSIDLSAASESELQAHMSDVVACLMRVWDTTVTKAGFEMPRPPVIVYSAAISTACGKLPTMNAAYCGSDQKIYYATDLPQAIPSGLRSSRFIVEVIVAHEFGHAVQARTGVLTAAHALGDAATSQTEANEWSRRTELQADCFAGLFIRSVSKSAGISQQDLDNIAALMISFGDDSLSKNSGVDGGHGLGADRKYWMQLGLASTTVSACNTFVATSDAVR